MFRRYLIVDLENRYAVEEKLSETCGKPVSAPTEQIPDYQGHPYADEIKAAPTRYVYYCFLPGAGNVKTRDITVYLVKDSSGNPVLYFIG